MEPKLDATPNTRVGSYQYSASQPDQFRLMTILPGTHDDSLLVKIDVHSLDEITAYQALSYCWSDGESDPTRKPVYCYEDQNKMLNSMAVLFTNWKKKHPPKTEHHHSGNIQDCSKSVSSIMVNLELVL